MMSSTSGSDLLPPEQQTLEDSVEFQGSGLHSGADARVVVRPGPVDSGIVFWKEGVRIPALAEYVTRTERCTALENQGKSVQMVEHLLAALHGLGIDNAHVEVEGPELPAMDGSALPYARRLLEAGVRTQGKPPREYVLRDVVWVREGDRHVLAFPNDVLTTVAAVDFGRPFAGPQSFCFSAEGPQLSHAVAELVGTVSNEVGALLPPLRQPALEGGAPLDVFLEELAPARTFCFYDWIEQLRAAGLGIGGSMDNTLVLSDDGPSTPMRYPDELARHKTLDLFGDVVLVGGRLRACVVAIKAGHSLHVAAAARIRRLTHGNEYPGDC